jgi:Icc protein
MPLRLAVIADIHHGPDQGTKKGAAALGLLEAFVDRVNGSGADAVIELGDRISDVGPDEDRELQRAVAARFLRLAMPRHHLAGNHDMAHLGIEENEAALDAPLASRAVTIGDIRIVLWQPDVQLTPERGFHLADGDLANLERLLGADERRTLLFTHVPLSGHAQIGNMYFERNPAHATYAELADIRRVIAAAPCPITAIAGHVHWNTLTAVDGTPHLTLQSLTESFTTGGHPAASTGLLTIDGETLSWSVVGLDPLSLTLDFPHHRRMWREPLPPFASEWSQ